MPKVTKIDDDTFNVTVAATTATTHRVTLDDDYYRELTSGKISKERLIQESFKFLLRRESNTSILKEFTLETIAQYFPDFPAEMKSRAHAKGGTRKQ